MKHLVAFLLVAVLPGAAQAIKVPGLGLDNPGLGNFGFGGYADQGYYALVKGAKNGTSTSSVMARMKAGHLGGPRPLSYGFPTSSGSTPVASSFLSSTLVPPFAAGIIGHVATNPSYSPTGPFLQGIIYEPDQVKRKGAPGGKARIQLKQKSYLAFRFGQFQGSGMGASPLEGGVIAAKCKGSADVKIDPSKTPQGSAKLKVKCSGNDTEVVRIKERLAEIFGKNKSGFDLNARFY